MGIIKVRDTSLYIEEYGKDQRSSLVYLHGGPGASCMDFQYQAKILGEYLHVISYDQRGVLRSDTIDESKPFGMVEHLVDLEALRIALGIERWSVIGHSYGGMLACLYANIYPDSVENVIYECPSWNFILSVKSIATYLLLYFHKKGNQIGIHSCNEIMNKSYFDTPQNCINDLMNILNMVEDAKERNYLHAISGEQLNSIYASYNIPNEFWAKSNLHFQKIIQDEKFFENYLPILAQNSQKQLLLCGLYDPCCGQEQRDFFVENVRNGKMVIFENSGHFPRLEQPEQYSKEVLDFII